MAIKRKGERLMKKVLYMLVVLSFIVAGCASNTSRGAGYGAGAGTIASVIAGKSGSTAALLIMGGALLGGAVGLAMDEQAKQASMQPANRNKTVMIVEEQPEQGTNCTKVTKRRWKNGKMIGETIEEICDGRKSTKTY